MESNSKLIQILREGVDIIKVILFEDLRGHLRSSRTEWGHDFVSKVAAAVVNEVFGVGNQEPALAEFVTAHRQEVDGVRGSLGEELPALRIPLTDALRTMVLCDYQENGCDTSVVLERAREWGILLAGRDLPLPNHFIDLVRRLGTAKGILQPVSATLSSRR